MQYTKHLSYIHHRIRSRRDILGMFSLNPMLLFHPIPPLAALEQQHAKPVAQREPDQAEQDRLRDKPRAEDDQEWGHGLTASKNARALASGVARLSFHSPSHTIGPSSSH